MRRSGPFFIGFLPHSLAMGRPLIAAEAAPVKFGIKWAFEAHPSSASCYSINSNSSSLTCSASHEAKQLYRYAARGSCFCYLIGRTETVRRFFYPAVPRLFSRARSMAAAMAACRACAEDGETGVSTVARGWAAVGAGVSVTLGAARLRWCRA